MGGDGGHYGVGAAAAELAGGLFGGRERRLLVLLGLLTGGVAFLEGGGRD